jgi:hypothetical protein
LVRWTGNTVALRFRELRVQPWSSGLVARSPCEKGEGRDQKKDNGHPILPLEAKNTEFLNKKLHRPARLLCKVAFWRRKYSISIE